MSNSIYKGEPYNDLLQYKGEQKGLAI